MSAPFTFTSGKHTFLVRRFRGREGINAPFSYTAELALDGDDPAELGRALLGQPGVLRFAVVEGASRAVQGVIEAVTTHDDALVVRLVAPLRTLRHRGASRILQYHTIPAAVQATLTRAGIALTLSLTRKYHTRTYCVQYRESDLDFALRRCAEEGLFFLVDDAGEVHLLDDPSFYPAIAGNPTLLYRPSREGESLHGEEHYVSSFKLRRSLRPGRLDARAYDFRRPRLPYASCATDTGPAPTLAVYEHHTSDLEPVMFRDDEARSRLIQYRHGAIRAQGQSRSPRLTAGHRFVLADHDAADGEHVIAWVKHEGHAPEVAGDGPTYTNRFACAPADTALAPRRPAMRIQQAAEMALVVGPEGEEIHTDDYGRVKVQFPWDREGHHDEQSSCWLRVAQPWAGAGFGALFLPRVGTEVLVTFVEGNVDQPIIVGGVYNGVSPTPFRLPGEATLSGIRTRSTPGGEGQHELSFEDAKGKEKIVIASARDLSVAAVCDYALGVGGDARVDVFGDLHEHVRADRTLDVGSMSINVRGGSISRCEGSSSSSVEGDFTQRVGGSMSIVVARHCALVAEGGQSIIVGGPERRASCSTWAFGDVTIGASEEISFDASAGIILRCGESAIEVRPNGITVRGNELCLVGRERVLLKGNGPSIRLDDNAEVAAKQLRLFAPGSSVILNKEAKIDGTTIKLNCNDEKPLGPDGEELAIERIPLRIKLTDPTYGSLASKRFHLLVDGTRYEGTTDAEGMLDKAIPKGAKSVTAIVWIGAYPEGEQRVMILRSPGKDPVQSAKAKLYNLGHYRGNVEGDAGPKDEALVEAIRSFQREVRLEETGQLDGPTMDRLCAVEKG